MTTVTYFKQGRTKVKTFKRWAFCFTKTHRTLTDAGWIVINVENAD